MSDLVEYFCLTANSAEDFLVTHIKSPSQTITMPKSPTKKGGQGISSDESDVDLYSVEANANSVTKKSQSL